MTAPDFTPAELAAISAMSRASRTLAAAHLKDHPDAD